MPASQHSIEETFTPLFAGTGGIDSWLLPGHTKPDVASRLAQLPARPLTRVQFNQLLVFANEAGMSDGFFRYYWLSDPDHTYDVKKLPRFDGTWLGGQAILSLNHLYWGLYRLYVDALLYFGNIRSAYRSLSQLSEDQLQQAFRAHRYSTEAIRRRGPALDLADIAAEERYLIAELACKTLAPLDSANETPFERIVIEAYERYRSSDKGSAVAWRALLAGQAIESDHPGQTKAITFVADEFLDEPITSTDDIRRRVAWVRDKWRGVYENALRNTDYYLSMVEDLDVYVATSMRSRQQFLEMAEFCRSVFCDRRLQGLHLRYFDPTLAAAEAHEDKGLIECLMVKCSKVLVYSAGEAESYGKDAEAAMALSLGKPVVFYCEQEERLQFLRDVHPLSRLIDFDTGVAVGAMVASKEATVAELLLRIFENDLEYVLEQPRPGYLRLKEQLTESVVRLQTSSELLRTTFWNYYHKQPKGPLGLLNTRHQP